MGKVLEPIWRPDEIQIDDGVSTDDRYSDLLPSPQGDLQVSNSVTPVRGRRAFQKLRELVMGQT